MRVLIFALGLVFGISCGTPSGNGLKNLSTAGEKAAGATKDFWPNSEFKLVRGLTLNGQKKADAYGMPLTPGLI